MTAPSRQEVEKLVDDFHVACANAVTDVRAMHRDGTADSEARYFKSSKKLSAARTALLSAIDAAVAGAREEAIAWRDFATDPPPKDGNPVLVWLSKPSMGSPFHCARFHKNVSTIGHNFAFDCPKPTHWATPIAPIAIRALTPPQEGK